MSDGSQVQYAYKEELTFGTSTAALLTTLADTGWTLIPSVTDDIAHNKNVVQSAVIRGDRTRPKSREVGVEVSGTLNSELILRAYDDLFEAALFSTTFSADGTPFVGATSVEFSGATPAKLTGASIEGSFAPGDWVFVTSWTTGTNVIVVARVLAESSNTLDVAVASVDGKWPIIEAGLTVTRMGVAVDNTDSSAPKTFVLERTYKDVPDAVLFGGMAVSGYTLEVATEQITALNFTWMGKAQLDHQHVQFSDAPDASEASHPSVDPIGNSLAIFHDGVNSNVLKVTNFSVTVENNLRSRLRIGEKGPYTEPGASPLSISGSFDILHEDKVLMDQWLNHTAVHMAFVCQDDYHLTVAPGKSRIMAFDFPSITLDEGGAPGTGEEADIVESYTFSAFIHPTQSVMHRIARTEHTLV